jgi:hypothetical protein
MEVGSNDAIFVGVWLGLLDGANEVGAWVRLFDGNFVGVTEGENVGLSK